jgi:uncharacterized protein (TIGR02001 family)
MRRAKAAAAVTFVSALLSNAVAAAEEAAATAPPPPPYTLTANVSLVSDYYFRGLTQTWHQPAIQGGFDFAHNSGFYLGTWASNVSSNQFPGGSMEWDFYGGYNYKLNDDITLGGGLIYYWYPGANYNKAVPPGPDQSFDTAEAYLNAGWKWLTFKYSYALTEYFGADASTGWSGDTRGTMYFDLSASYPLPIWEGLSLVAHVGYTYFSESYVPGNNGETDPSYWDWKLGVTKTWDGGWNVGVYYVQASNQFWENTPAFITGGGTKDLNAATVILQVGKTF